MTVPDSTLLTTTLRERFLAKIDKGPHPRGCWMWKTRSNCISHATFAVTHTLKVGAHVASYRFLRGPIPEGMFVCHRCDTPRCVNPDHLFLGDHSANMRDAAAKGRLALQHSGRIKRARGHRHSQSKLTETDVRQIRKEVAAGVSLATLARGYGCSGTCIKYIATRRNWAHVTDES